MTNPAAKRSPRTILATACIPWDERGMFMEHVFVRQVEMLLDRGIRHIYLFGTAGEGYGVSESQFDAVVSAFAQVMRQPGRFPMVGLISLSLPVMLHRIERAYAMGIRDFMFALPGWGALNDRELLEFLHRLCDPFPDCRFVHYNLMRSNRLVQPAEYVRLAEEIPNLAGGKFTTDDIRVIHRLLQTEATPLQYFLGEPGFGYGSLIGECGLLISIAISNLRRAWEFFDAAVRRDAEKVLGFIRELTAMHSGLMKATVERRMDGAYDKLIFKLVWPEFPLRLLPPYETYSEEQYRRYRAFLEEHFPEWLE